MGVIGSSYMFSNFYRLYYTTKRVLHLQIYDEASPKISLKIGPLHLFSYGYRKCMFVDSLPENIGPPSQLCHVLIVE